jgi:hypothetical protein
VKEFRFKPNVNLFEHKILKNLFYFFILWAGRLRVRSLSPSRIKNFLHVVQTSSEAHTSFYPMGGGAVSLAVKWPGGRDEAGYLAPTSAEVKKHGSVHQLPHMSFWHQASLAKHKDNFTFYIKIYLYMRTVKL